VRAHSGGVRKAGGLKKSPPRQGRGSNIERSDPPARPPQNPAPSRLRVSTRDKKAQALQRSHPEPAKQLSYILPLRSWQAVRVASTSEPYSLSSATASISSGPALAATATFSAAKPPGRFSAKKAGPSPRNSNPDGSAERAAGGCRCGWTLGRTHKCLITSFLSCDFALHTDVLGC
jgi:hypothetical protein